jgi:hypothetical protein
MLVRCEKHTPRSEKYARYCGRRGCETSGRVWLSAGEWGDYQAGLTVFGEGVTNALHVRVKSR